MIGIMVGMAVLSSLLALAIWRECRELRKLANHMHNREAH